MNGCTKFIARYIARASTLQPGRAPDCDDIKVSSQKKKEKKLAACLFAHMQATAPPNLTQLIHFACAHTPGRIGRVSGVKWPWAIARLFI